MVAGVATRRHARIAEPVGRGVIDGARSTGRSAVSRQFVKRTETALAELLSRYLTGKDIKVLMLDGEHLADTCVIVALAITAGGEKFPVGLWDGAKRRTRPSLRRCSPTSSAEACRLRTGCWW
jgi:putative transposase